MAQERTGLVTFKGGPMTLIGPELKVGDKAPDFALVDGSLQTVTLASSAGKTRLLSVVPSLDTPVCQIQTKQFNEKAASLGGDVVVYTVSVDLPFAMKRFCSAEKADKVVPVSDYKDHSFGVSYGVRIKELGLLARAIFVIGPDDRIKYIELVREVADQPNYDAALAAL